jgi:hypothetical protein
MPDFIRNSSKHNLNQYLRNTSSDVSADGGTERVAQLAMRLSRPYLAD